MAIHFFTIKSFPIHFYCKNHRLVYVYIKNHFSCKNKVQCRVKILSGSFFTVKIIVNRFLKYNEGQCIFIVKIIGQGIFMVKISIQWILCVKIISNSFFNKNIRPMIFIVKIIYSQLSPRLSKIYILTIHFINNTKKYFLNFLIPFNCFCFELYSRV